MRKVCEKLCKGRWALGVLAVSQRAVGNPKSTPATAGAFSSVQLLAEVTAWWPNVKATGPMDEALPFAAWR